MNEEDLRVKNLLAEALRDAFGEHEASKRFVDVTRIPLLCKSIIDTNKRLENIESMLSDKYVTKEAFTPIKSLVYGATGLILVSVVGALLTLVVMR